MRKAQVLFTPAPSKFLTAWDYGSTMDTRTHITMSLPMASRHLALYQYSLQVFKHREIHLHPELVQMFYSKLYDSKLSRGKGKERRKPLKRRKHRAGAGKVISRESLK